LQISLELPKEFTEKTKIGKMKLTINTRKMTCKV